MLATKLTLTATAVVVLAGFLGALAVGTGEAPPPAPGKPPAPAAREGEADQPSESPVVVTGRVLDPDGKPVAGARIFYPSFKRNPPVSEDDVEVVQGGVTGEDGRFRVELTQVDLHPELPVPLVAAADGFGIDWAELPKGERRAELTFRLAKDRPIRMRVIDTEGRPVAGAKVRVKAVLAPSGGIDGFVTAWKQEWRMAVVREGKRLFLPPDRGVSVTATGQDGRFEITGVGAERVASVEVEGPSIAKTAVYVVTRAGFDPDPVNRAVLRRVPPELRLPGQPPMLFGPEVGYVVEPSRVIEGTVRDAETGEPLAGIRVSGSGSYSAHRSGVTDSEGRFRLEGGPRERQYLVHAGPPADTNYLRAGARVDDEPGPEPLRVDLVMARGVVVIGRVFDKATGRGVQSGIRFAPLPENTYFGKPGYDTYKTDGTMRSTDPDGTFRLAVVPGPGVLMAQVGGGREFNGAWLKPYKVATVRPEDRERLNLSEDGRRFTGAGGRLESLEIEHAVKVLDLKPGGEPVTCDLEVDPGRTVEVHIRDDQGKPLTGTVVSGMTASWPIAFPLTDDSCTVCALDPEEPRRLVFYHPERNLGGTLTVRGDEKEPPVAKLDPAGSVTGRVLDIDGQPIAGATVRLSWPGEILRELYRRLNLGREPVRADAQGRFRIDGIVPGMEFYLGISEGRTSRVPEPRIGRKSVAAGQTLDLGDIRTKRLP